MIIHIVKKEVWEQVKTENIYKGDTLESQGFIHCSKPNQVVEVANHIFRGQKDLVLIIINDAKVLNEIRYEGVENDELYPHIYGPLNLDAVIDVVDFPTQEDGRFKLPELVQK